MTFLGRFFSPDFGTWPRGNILSLPLCLCHLWTSSGVLLLYYKGKGFIGLNQWCGPWYVEEAIHSQQVNPACCGVAKYKQTGDGPHILFCISGVGGSTTFSSREAIWIICTTANSTYGEKISPLVPTWSSQFPAWQLQAWHHSEGLYAPLTAVKKTVQNSLKPLGVLSVTVNTWALWSASVVVSGGFAVDVDRKGSE